MSLIAEIVSGSFVDFTAVDVSNFRVGTTLSDVLLGNVFTLAVSSAAVDHVTVESVAGHPELRWLIQTVPGTLTAAQLTALINPATASLKGAMSAAQFTQLNHFMVIETPVIDLTQTGATAFLVPALPAGLFPMAIILKGFLVSGAGTQTTSPTISFGQNSPTFNNWLTATAFSTATAQSNVPAPFITTNGATAPYLDLLANPPSANVTVAAVGTGGFAARAKLAAWVWFSTLT
jgi:hypothetical protein